MTNLIRIFLGLVFLLFGLAKLFPVESFEFLLVDHQVIGWSGAPILARLIVFWEVLLGLALVMNFQIKKTLWLTFLTLTFLTLYLIYDLISFGNRLDCGCTGQLFELSTEWSLLKNFFLLLFVALLLKKGKPYYYLKTKWISLGLIAISVATVLIIAPFYMAPPPAQRINIELDLSVLPQEELSGKALDFKNQNLLLFFVSPKCSHCQLAMEKIKIIKSQNEMIPVILVFYAKQDVVNAYMKEKNLTFPYIIFPNDEFMQIVSGHIPTILHMNHGILEHVWIGPQFDPDELINL